MMLVLKSIHCFKTGLTKKELCRSHKNFKYLQNISGIIGAHPFSYSAHSPSYLLVQTISNQADIALGFWDIVPTKKRRSHWW